MPEVILRKFHKMTLEATRCQQRSLFGERHNIRECGNRKFNNRKCKTGSAVIHSSDNTEISLPHPNLEILDLSHPSQTFIPYKLCNPFNVI